MVPERRGGQFHSYPLTKEKKGPTNVGAIDKMLFPYCETVDQ